MPRLDWSDGANRDLRDVVKIPRLITQLKNNAATTLHDTQDALPDDPDEGAAYGVMWHRGFTHDQQHQIKAGTLPEPPSEDGPQVWDFFLYYKPKPWSINYDFEVLHVRTKYDIASRM